MRLNSIQQAESITPFGVIDNLPDFIILTGYNGSGKTHLLRGISQGRIQVDALAQSESVYFDYLQFKLQAQQVQNVQQINQLKEQSWTSFTGQNNNGLQRQFETHFNSTLRGANINALLQSCEETNTPFRNATDLADNALKPKLEQYLQWQDQQFNAITNSTSPQNAALPKIASNYPKPLHTIDKETFKDLCDVSLLQGNAISSNIVAEFGDYTIRKFNYSNSDRSRSAIDMEKEFEEKLTPPWVVINEILAEFDQFKEIVYNEPVLTASITGIQTNFPVPQIRVDGIPHPINFSNLSSGEQVLLSLAIAIYKHSKEQAPPKVLLLDEVDATLHPQITKKLLNVLDRVFVQKGVKVIIATHSPSTVALAPEKAVCVIKKKPIANESKLSQVDKRVALDILSEGFMSMMPNDRIVITEAQDDADYYQSIHNFLCRKEIIPTRPSLRFIPACKEQHPESGGGVQQVDQWASKLHNLELSHFVGLVDRDTRGDQNTENQYLKVLERSAIENYWCDPVVLLAIMVDLGAEGQLPSWNSNLTPRAETLFELEQPQLEQLVKDLEKLMGFPHNPTAEYHYPFSSAPINISSEWRDKRGHDLAGVIKGKFNSPPLQAAGSTQLINNSLSLPISYQTSRFPQIIPTCLTEVIKKLKD